MEFPALDIRRLTDSDDLATFGRMVLDSYLAVAGMPREPEYERELEDVAARVRDGVVYGAFLDGRAVGCVTFVPDPTDPHAERLADGESSFRMLAVDTSAQGRGVGDALVRECLRLATAAGSDAVFIHSGTWMHAAHRLYLRLGFEFVPERDWTLDDIHLLGLRRPVTSA